MKERVREVIRKLEGIKTEVSGHLSVGKVMAISLATSAQNDVGKKMWSEVASSFSETEAKFRDTIAEVLKELKEIEEEVEEIEEEEE